MITELDAHPLLASLDPADRATIAAAFAVRDLPAGAVLVEAGAPGGPLHIVLAGWLDVLDADDGGLVVQLGPGALIGELGLLRDAPSTARVRSTTDVLVATLADADARRIAGSSPAFAMALGRVAAERVHGPPEVRVRPSITAVVSLGDWSDVVEAGRRRAARSRRVRAIDVHDWPEQGGAPGTAAHRAGTIALAEALDGIDRLFIWTRAEEPGLSRALRSADRVVVLGPPQRRMEPALLTHIAEQPADAEADIVLVEVEAGVEVSGIGPAPMPGVRALRLTAEDRVPGAMRELERRGLIGVLLADSPIFGDLRPAVRHDLERHLSWRAVPSGAVVYDAGEAPGGLYMVLSGRVAEYRAQRVDYLPGFVFGDDGLGGAHVAPGTTRAVRDSTLAFVERSALRRLCARHESLRVALAEQAGAGIARLRTAAISDRAAILVVLPDHDPVWQGRVEQLRTVLGGSRCLIVDRPAAERTLGAGIVEAHPGSARSAQLRGWLGRIEEHHRYLICVAHADDASWLRFCLGQTEHRLLLADGRSDPGRLSEAGRGSARHLALWWPADGLPSETQRWLALDPTLTWHHVREDRFDDLGRLVRRLLGRAIGLVLGGASSRCVAHLGVVDAVREAALPIDIISGTSSGSWIAGLVALQLPPDEALRRSVEGGNTFRLGLDNISPPFVSMFSGRRARRLIRAVFGEVQIEDLLVPVRATAVDLRSGSTIVLDRGPLWRAVRSASSIPGMWPPVAIEGRLLVDGGLIDNFPYGIIEADCAAGLTVVSNLDAGYVVPFVGAPDYGDVLSGWKVLLDKLLGRGTIYPQLTGTVVECLVLGGRASSADLEDRIDPRRVLVVRPPIPKLELFGLEDGPMVRQLVDVAHESTRDALAAWRTRFGDGVAYSTFVAAPGAGD